MGAQELLRRLLLAKRRQEAERDLRQKWLGDASVAEKPLGRSLAGDTVSSMLGHITAGMERDRR